MIKIIYEADPEGGKLTMRAEGHAGYAPAGQDIVCAAVSCLMQTLAYSAAEDEHTSSCIYQGKDGPVVSVEAGDSVLMRDKFELVADGLDLLAGQYPENVNFKKRCKCSPAVDLQLFASDAAEPFDLQLFAATATTAACGRSREELLGPRPAGCSAVLGAITFCIQGCVQWDGTHVAISMIMLSLLCTIFFIPAMPGVGYEVRGNGEMFPLNGPCWSLFFEYIGNILYALFIRRLSNKALAVLVVMLGMALASFAVFNVSGYGNMGVGWTLDGVNFLGGTLRMLFPFSLGMLMSRNFKPMKVNGAFWICTIILIALFSVPYLEGLEPICMNGIYEAFCVIVVFPFLVWLGASGTTTDKQSTKICKFLGDISYPVYVVHYPLMYLFYAWLIENKLYTLGETWYVAVGVFVLSVILACLCLKLYDEPVRKWLTKKFLAPK